MAKKKITKNDIVGFYMEHVLEKNADPTSVYKFSKDNSFDEQLFYTFFSSFESLKKEIFTSFFENTMSLLHKSDEFKGFDPRNQLLTFYFTFFENLTANRSYVLYSLKGDKNKLKTLEMLKGLRKHFKAFIGGLEIEKLDLKQEKLEKIQNSAIEEGAWAQLLMTMKFWAEDSSPSFEKTDIFIEKSVNASFDLINLAPVKSVLDLGKFLYKETMMHK